MFVAATAAAPTAAVAAGADDAAQKSLLYIYIGSHTSRALLAKNTSGALDLVGTDCRLVTLEDAKVLIRYLAIARL